MGRSGAAARRLTTELRIRKRRAASHIKSRGTSANSIKQFAIRLLAIREDDTSTAEALTF